MCCCCPRPGRCCHPKVIKFVILLVVLGFLFNAVISFFSIMTWLREEEEIEAAYPLLFKDSSGYHNTRAIIKNLEKLTPTNPYYSRLEEFNPLAVYGPIAERDDRHVRVAVICGQHARELITSEICHNLIRLVQFNKAHPLLTDRIATLIAKGVGFWVAPVVNEWGREQIEGDPTKACLRKNQNQVDLNRNFPCPDLIRESAVNPPAALIEGLSHPGEFDLSEEESRTTVNFLKTVKPDILFNVHSGIDRVLLPYDCCSLSVHKNYKKMVEVAQLAKMQVKRDFPGLNHTNPANWYTGSSSMLLYESHGTLMDYASYFLQTPFVYTLEVFENKTSIPDELSETEFTPIQCMTLFNPQAGKPFEEVNLAWLDFIVSLIEVTLERFELVIQEN